MLRTLLVIATLITNAHAQVYPESATGMILGIDEDKIAVETSPGTQIIVDITPAKLAGLIGTPIQVGRNVVVQGHHAGEVFMASVIYKGL